MACPAPHPCCRRLQAHVLSSHPSLAQRLQRLQLADTWDASLSARAPPLPPLAALTRLRSLRLYQRDGLALPGELTALSGSLTSLHASVRYADDPLRVGTRLAALTGLRALWLQHASFEAGAPEALAALPSLHTLALVGSVEQYECVLRALGAPPPPTAPGPRPLRALRLEAHASAVAEVPPAAWVALAELSTCPGLERLELPFCRLTHFLDGPWLTSLQASKGGDCGGQGEHGWRCVRRFGQDGSRTELANSSCHRNPSPCCCRFSTCLTTASPPCRPSWRPVTPCERSTWRSRRAGTKRRQQQWPRWRRCGRCRACASL